jgi:glycerol-3-phosphate dehydrogenase subunit B
MRYDVVVIGAGVAGLTAGARLAEGGARVCVLAKGMGSTHLAPGTVDVLGYDGGGRVESPASALPDFVSRHPDHPYALVSVAPALEWLAGCVERGPKPGYRYVGSLERNVLLPTALGAARPSALVPSTMAGGDLGDPAPICVVGFRVLRDFHASLCAANIARSGVEARGVEIDLNLHTGRAEENSLGIARHFDDPGFRSAFSTRVAPSLRPGERLGLPAVLGVRGPQGALTDLEQRLDRPVFEIPTLPPSAPGIRVYDILRAALRSAGGRLVIGAEVVGASRDGTRITSVRAHASGHDHVYEARWFVLATGGVASGAIELGSDWLAHETALGLSLSGAPADGAARFDPDYFAEQPLNRMGVAVDSSLTAEGTENVLVAGAALPGAIPWREGSGEGISLSTGYAAAKTVLERQGAAAAA